MVCWKIGLCSCLFVCIVFGGVAVVTDRPAWHMTREFYKEAAESGCIVVINIFQAARLTSF